MGQARAHHRTNAEEFLAWDSMQTLRHEFVCGELFLKAGAEDRNNTAAGNLCMALRLHLHLHLRGSAWRVYARDIKLRVEAADCYFYPDAMVTSSTADVADRLIKREPALVVEVLSASAAAFDRGIRARHSTAATSLPPTDSYPACMKFCWLT